MVKIVWTEKAIQDLNDIGEYIAKDSERYAAITIQNLFNSTEILELHPKAGRIVLECNNDTMSTFKVRLKKMKCFYQFQ